MPIRPLSPARLPLVVVAGLSLVLAACSSSADTDPDSGDDTAGSRAAAGDSLLPPPEGTTEYPLTLTTPYGESVLQERPERVAVIGGLGDFEATVELGVTPVLAPYDPADAWAWEPQDLELINFNPWNEDGLQRELLLEADPDVIIAVTYDQLADDYDTLTSIAPVVALEEETDQPWAWRGLTTTVGEALDLGAAAQESIATTEAYVAEHAQPQFEGSTIGFVINYGQTIGLSFRNTAGSPSEELLTELGFATHPNAEVLAETQGDLALEQVELIDADYLIVARHGGDGSVDEAADWLETNSLYKSLTAVQDEQVAYIDPNELERLDIAWALSYPSSLSIRWTVDELTTALEPLTGS